jgi:DnaJ-domain-containing protein 1
MGRERFKAFEVAEALTAAGGNKAAAARALKCDRKTITRYMRRYVSVQEAYEQATESNLDLAENILMTNLRVQFVRQQRAMEAANTGTGDLHDAVVDAADAKWLLRMKGGSRGYAERQQLETLMKNLSLSEMTTDQLERLADGEDPLRVLASTG